MFGVSKDDEVGEGVDHNGRVSEMVEEKEGLSSETDVIKTVLLEGEVGDDLVAIALEVVLTTLSQLYWKVSHWSKMVPR